MSYTAHLQNEVIAQREAIARISKERDEMRGLQQQTAREAHEHQQTIHDLSMALALAQQESRDLRAAIERSGYEIIDGTFVRSDGTRSRFYLHKADRNHE